jgi:hypothetical protein
MNAQPHHLSLSQPRSHLSGSFKPIRLAAATAVAFGTCLTMVAAHAAPMAKADVDARKQSIEAQYKSDKAACDSQAGNAKDICVLEAKGKDKVARATLDYDQTGKAADQQKLAKVKADTAYDVAKEKCDDLAGNPKDVCVQEAKSAHVKALADAKLAEQTGKARSEAASDKNDAAYKVETEKCEALAGAAKDSCVATAKQRFGKS